MKIMEFLNEKAVTIDLKAKDKPGVVRELVDLLAKAQGIRNKEEIIKVLLNRESLGSTGIGMGVGIPHGKTNSIKEIVAACGISKNGVNFESLDGEPAYIFFLLLAPENSAGPHLKALARISRLLKDKYFRDILRSLPDEKALIRALREEDQKKQ